MTDEEMAVNWIRSQGWSEENLPSDEFLEKMQDYLAGLEAGRPKWHKVADGDLPKENKRYLCKIKGFVGSGISYECFDYDTEYSSWKNACGDVIAWCEIPKYTEV
jgi:hypothetical protein